MRKIYQMMSVIMCMMFLLITPYATVFSEPVGGSQVTVEGTISFKDSEAPKKEDPTSETYKKEDSKSGELSSNPFNKLPQTGELINRYWLPGVLLILPILFLLYFRKRGDKA